MMEKISIEHGSGGRLTHQLIQNHIKSKLQDQISFSNDCGHFFAEKKRFALTTDSYVVDPLFFPGGDIGKLAIAGTLNDLSTSASRPLALSLSFIIEEGLRINLFDKIMDSISYHSNLANVPIITGDTKVVEKNHGDGIFINTTGVGVIEHNLDISLSSAKIGDHVFISGPIGQHEICLMKARGLIDFDINIKSDVQYLHHEILRLLDLTDKIHVLKDPTRGGLASALFEIAHASNKKILINEEDIPLDPETYGICELLGLDPLYLANEGKFIIIGGPEIASIVNEVFPKAKRIGNVEKKLINEFHLILKTREGGSRKLGMLETSQLPRIC